MRWLPASARIVAVPWLAQLCEELLGGCRRRCFGIEPTAFHRTGRFRQELQRALATELAAREPAVDRLVAEVALALGAVAGEVLAVQARPYARVVPPGAPDAVKDFHWDAYLGHPTSQWGLWVPLADVEADEALRLVDDEITRPWVARGELVSDAVTAMRAAGRPVPVRRGEVLVMQAVTGHGGVAHSRDVTRLSFDLRFARDGAQPRGALGWRSRQLVLGG